MFPNKYRDELENSLKVQGSLSQAVMTLIKPEMSPVPFHDESDLMCSAFEGLIDSLEDSPCSLREELNKF